MSKFFLTICFGLMVIAVGTVVTIVDTRANPGDGRMILFFDGATIPAGWTCISCNPGDPFYERFVRGFDSYGAAGGALSHSHTYNDAISTTNESAVSENWNSGDVSAAGHSHALTTELSEESNLPEYRQLRVIRYDQNGEPGSIPGGAIALFESGSMPAGWTRYSVQDGYYIRGADAFGIIGGSNTHSHDITGNIGAEDGATLGSRGGGQQVNAAAAGHTHTFSSQSSEVDTQPPYREVVLGQATTNTFVPSDIVAMWDDEQPADWQLRSNEAGPYYGRFIKPSSSFGGSGGSLNHSHPTTAIASSPPSATVNARAGSGGASDSHTHTITISDYSEEEHVPPYRNVIIAKKQDPSDISLTSYRWFRNQNDASVGLALAGQDSGATSIGLPFRLRLTLSVSVADLGPSGESFRLQYAERVGGVCDPSFTNESYVDVLTNSGVIRYQNNPDVDDGNALTPNLNDPTLSSGSRITQSYTESNNFTNNVAPIPIGDYGLWDFALRDAGAPSDTTYCFRVVYADGSLLSNYDVVPELTTDDGAGNMVVLFGGGTVPSGWTCISCNPGEPLYERFARGAGSYGATGGSATHAHTADGTVLPALDEAGSAAGDGGLSGADHGHLVSPILDESSNLPPYRQLKYIRSDVSGTPASLPAGTIALFDDTVADGWTRLAVQDGNYMRGHDDVGVTGGSLTHSHNVIGVTSSGDGQEVADGGGGPASAAAAVDHQHTLLGESPEANHEPPFIEVLVAELNDAASPPAGLITFWDGTPPGSWDIVSSTGQPFHQRFVKPASAYGATGGSETHTHTNHQVTTSGPSITAGTRLNGGGSASAAHTHPVDIANVSDENHLPPYINVVIAKQPVPNTPPNTPEALQQFRVTLGDEIGAGGFTNERQVHFRAELTDPDDNDQLQLCVEVQPITNGFADAEQNCGDSIAYTGSPVVADVVITGLADTEEYKWQARTRDNAGEYSDWVDFGDNGLDVADFSIDTIEPSGMVFDGATEGVDITYGDDSLDSLSANWDIDSGLSGLGQYEYSIGTSPATTDVLNWVSNGVISSVTANDLTLRTSEVYYVNVRTTDNAGNQSIISSSGQLVAPSISFSVSQSAIEFDRLSESNDFSDSQDIDVITSTNARGGYIVRARAAGPLASASDAIPMFNGGSYDEPGAWVAPYVGFGYTSSDTSVQGEDIFGRNPCPGGGSPPCFAPFTLSFPGDIIADNQGPVTGSPIIDEVFTMTNRVVAPEGQSAGDYQTVIIFSATALY